MCMCVCVVCVCECVCVCVCVCVCAHAVIFLLPSRRHLLLPLLLPPQGSPPHPLPPEEAPVPVPAVLDGHADGPLAGHLSVVVQLQHDDARMAGQHRAKVQALLGQREVWHLW